MSTFDGTNGKDKLVVTEGAPSVNGHVINGLGDSDTISVISATKESGTIATANNNTISADGAGPVGADKILISATSSESSAQIFENTIHAGDGKNKIVLKGTNGKSASGIADVFGNDIEAGSDADSISLVAKGSWGTMSENEILAGDGKNKISLEASSLTDGNTESLSENTVTAMGGDDSLSVKLTGKTKDSFAGSLRENEFNLGDGKNSVKIAASDGAISMVENSIETGVNDDKIDLKIAAKTKGRETAIVMEENTIISGDGKDGIKISLSSASGAQAENNSVLAGGGDDKINFSVKAGATGYDAVSGLRGNSIDAGDGKNEIKLTHSAKEQLTHEGNLFRGGMNDDKISIKAKSSDSLNFNDNSIDAGDGANNDVKVDLGSSSSDVSLMGNHVDVSGGYQDFDMKLSASKGDVYLGDNTFLIGGDNEVNVNAKGNTVDVTLNSFQYSGGASTDYSNIQLKLTGKAGVTFDQNTLNDNDGETQFKVVAKADSVYFMANELALGGDTSNGEDPQFIELSGTGGYVQFEGNTLSADDTDAELRIMAKSKGFARIESNQFEATGMAPLHVDIDSTSKGRAYVYSNVVNGSDSNDEVTLSIKSDGSNISGNIFRGYGGDDVFTVNLDVKNGSTKYFLDNNSIHGGDDTDTLQVFTKGEQIRLDLIDGDEITGIEYLEIGPKNTLIINVDNVDLISGDDTLFISGKGSTIQTDFSLWNEVGTVVSAGGQNYYSFTDIATGNLTLNIEASMGYIDSSMI